MPVRGTNQWFKRLVESRKARRATERPFVLDDWVPFSFVVGFESRRPRPTPEGRVEK